MIGVVTRIQLSECQSYVAMRPVLAITLSPVFLTTSQKLLLTFKLLLPDQTEKCCWLPAIESHQNRQCAYRRQKFAVPYVVRFA